MPSLNFHQRLLELNNPALAAIYRECTPRVLVVTDTLNFSSGDGFGLTQFVKTLQQATIHGMTPQVKTASRYASPGAELSNFDFNDPTHGLSISRYDVLFLFGAASEGIGDLPAPQVETIARFMQDGGGVFATGDHETLGAALCGNLPRVRQMRKWKAADAPPHVSSIERHSTNLSGSDETEEFNDQSDTLPQRLYLNFRTRAGGSAGIDRAPHPLMQLRGRRKVLEVFPDHPHEGECRLPASLSGSFTLQGRPQPEWPKDAAGADVTPEIAAYSVSHGDGFPTGPTGPKQGLVPKLFPAIAAYDGQRAGVGRVVTDATWHHFININLDGTGSGLPGLRRPTPAGYVDAEALIRIRQHYVNLATWLMPAKVRRCLRFPLVVKELQRYPLFEELDLPRPPEPMLPALRRLGEGLMQSLGTQVPAWEALALADDALQDALGVERLAKLQQSEPGRLAGPALSELAQTALGGLAMAVVTEIAESKGLESIRAHKSFEDAAARGARQAVQLLMAEQCDGLRKLNQLLDSLRDEA